MNPIHVVIRNCKLIKSSELFSPFWERYFLREACTFQNGWISGDSQNHLWTPPLHPVSAKRVTNFSGNSQPKFPVYNTKNQHLKLFFGGSGMNDSKWFPMGIIPHTPWPRSEILWKFIQFGRFILPCVGLITLTSNVCNFSYCNFSNLIIIKGKSYDEKMLHILLVRVTSFLFSCYMYRLLGWPLTSCCKSISSYENCKKVGAFDFFKFQ